MKARREFLKLAGAGMAGAVAVGAPAAWAETRQDPTDGMPSAHGTAVFEVTAFGAKGDGHAIDTPAINRAIDAAAAAGGGTVHFAAGQYLCYSVHLKSNVALHLDQGAVIVAADPLPARQPGGYDNPGPPQPWEAYQDFGHNHWRNSLIWGEDLHDISIFGPGRIWGRGLVRSNGPHSHNPEARRIDGVGNKSISLKNCRNVTLRGFQILQGGWFGILATGVDNFTIDGLAIDTNRDGMDIDCCRNVRIVNTAVNSPWDDGIVLKSSYALGHLRSTENVEIANCYVTGTYEVGSMLGGTWKKFPPDAKVWRTGRIKFGTESNGGFKNIAIANCVFDGCQGLALETVDGAHLEDVVITNITMRDITSAPIFLRLGSRLRGPAGSTKTGVLRRVSISNLVCSNADSAFGCIVSGVPGFDIEDVKFQHIHIQHRGGGTKEQAAIVPSEDEHKYPEPNMFGTMPSQGFYVRHAKNIELSDIEIAAISEDARPGFVFQDVNSVDCFHLKSPANAPVLVLHDSKNIQARWVRGVKDGELA